MAQVVGIIDLVWNGTKIAITPGSGTLMLGGLVNKEVTAGRQIHRAQLMQPSEVQGTTVLQAGQSLAALFDGADHELQVIADTGQSYVISEAFLIDSGNLHDKNGGEVKMTWRGSAAIEVL